MGKLFKRITEAIPVQIFAILIVGSAMTIGATIWAFFLSWGPAIILVFMGGVAFTLFTINQYKAWKGKKETNFESLVRDWLYKHKFTIRDHPNDKALFQIACSDEASRKFEVARLKEDKQFLAILARFTIPNNNKEEIDKLTEDASSTFILDLRIEFIRFGIGYEGIQHPLRAIIFKAEVPCDDSLTELTFMQQVMFVRRAILLINEIISRKLKESK